MWPHKGDHRNGIRGGKGEKETAGNEMARCEFKNSGGDIRAGGSLHTGMTKV